MRKQTILNLVSKICDTKSTDCRSLNKVEIARELLNMAHVPSNAEISEIPLDINNQVVVLFLLPGDKKYYSLFAGIGNDGRFHFELSITGTLKDDGYFHFFKEDKILDIGYFQKKRKVFFLYYEDGKIEKLSMRDVYRMYDTSIDQHQKNQGTTFQSWLAEMEKMQILIRESVV